MHGLDGGFRLGDDLVVTFRLAHLDQLDVVGELLLEIADAVDARLELLPLAHERLGLFRVVPELRILGGGIQFIEFLQRGIPVKDASSAVRSTA